MSSAVTRVSPMTLYAPLVLGSPSWLSHRVWRYETAISTLCGTSNSRAASLNCVCSAAAAEAGLLSVVTVSCDAMATVPIVAVATTAAPTP